jgi:hypothetical protein
MLPEQSSSEATRTTVQARAARARRAARSRIATARAAIIAAVAGTTCGLALFIQSSASGSSNASARTSAGGVPGSVQPLFDGGGGSASDDGGVHGSDGYSSGASPPGVSSGQGDVVSGGS